MTCTSEQSDSAWEDLWNARKTALEQVFGPASDMVFHSVEPFHLGGAADVLEFPNHVGGIAYVTADSIGDDQSKPNEHGQYELAIVLRGKGEWAANLISNLAQYTRDAVLESGDTMDIGPALPQPTQLTAFLFIEYAQIEVLKEPANILLCLGITSVELDFAKENGADALLHRLKQAGVFPYTDLTRQSVE